MNCKQTAQLIPLFVEADLGAAEMQQVTTHIETCNSCRNLATEFQSSQSSLHALSLPAFDEAMMTRIRNAVQHEIAPPISHPSIADLLSLRWNWKFAFVAAAVVLLISGIVLLRRGAEHKNIPIAAKPNGSEVPAPRPASAQKNLLAQNVFHPRTARKNKAQSGVSVIERNPVISPRPARAIDIENQIASASIAQSRANNDLTALPRIDSQSFILPLAPQAESATLNFEKSVPEPEMLRMEIQTADPNIKIIWLVPKEPTRTNTISDTK